MAFESGRPRATVTAVLLAAIAGAVYVLAPLSRKSGRAGARGGEEELWDAVEALRDRVNELADQVAALEARLPSARRRLLKRN
jgi:hypothetical protein